jgi:hypothetical protein
VEGPSDKDCLKALLSRLMIRAEEQGVKIDFFPQGGKKPLLNKCPAKAANIVLNNPSAQVVILPDLYPKNMGGLHETKEELIELVQNRFQEALRRKQVKEPEALQGRFHVHCFKYDLEALLLASVEEVATYLGETEIKRDWKLPVEDQDHDYPPKRILEKLFQDRDKKYKDTIDAPAILGQANLDRLKKECPQCFAPLVQLLETFAS